MRDLGSSFREYGPCILDAVRADDVLVAVRVSEREISSVSSTLMAILVTHKDSNGSTSKNTNLDYIYSMFRSAPLLYCATTTVGPSEVLNVF